MNTDLSALDDGELAALLEKAKDEADRRAAQPVWLVPIHLQVPATTADEAWDYVSDILDGGPVVIQDRQSRRTIEAIWINQFDTEEIEATDLRWHHEKGLLP
jgi:hypothetical protein